MIMPQVTEGCIGVAILRVKNKLKCIDVYLLFGKHYDFQKELNALEDKQKSKENRWFVVCQAIQRKVMVLLLNTQTKNQISPSTKYKQITSNQCSVT